MLYILSSDRVRAISFKLRRNVSQHSTKVTVGEIGSGRGSCFEPPR